MISQQLDFSWRSYRTTSVVGICNSGVAPVSILPETTLITKVLLGSRTDNQSSLTACTSEDLRTASVLAANGSALGSQEGAPCCRSERASGDQRQIT